MGFNACTCSLDHLDPTSNAHGAPAKCLDLICNRRATIHADVSSAAAEIYAAGNATLDFMHLSYVADEMGLKIRTDHKQAGHT